VGWGNRPHLVSTSTWLWVIAQRDSAVVGWALDASGAIRDSFRLDRPGALTHPYTGVWGTLTPEGRLMLVWSERDGSGRDLYYALSATTAVAEVRLRPKAEARTLPVDLLGRRVARPLQGVKLLGGGRKEVVLP